MDATTWSRAPRACSSPSSACKSWAERRWIDVPDAADSGCERRPDAMTSSTCPTADGRVEPYAIRNAPLAAPRRQRRRRASTASPMRRRMSSPIRSPTTIPGSMPAIDWDATIAFRALSLGPRPRRRRGDGHRAARHGPRLAGAQELIRRSLEAAQEPARRADRLRRRHRPSRARRRTSRSTTSSAPTRSRSRRSKALGGRIILMASRALAAAARGPGRLRARLRPHPVAR